MIRSLRLQNFRSYKDTQLEFEPGVNVIVGPNASGKTSILEAVLMMLHGSSFKGSDYEVVQFSQDWARLDSGLDGEETRTVKIEKTDPEHVRKSFVIDEVEKTRLAANHVLPVVLFEPQHMALLGGEPALRRDFLDTVLGSTKPNYSGHLKNYRRALAQRNALLKQPNRTNSDLFVWDLRLSELGGVVFAARNELVETMNLLISTEYGRISARDDKVDMRYYSALPAGDYANNLFKKLSLDHDKDFGRGFTGSGPHRDDFVLSINGHDAQSSASRGETRSLLLALKVLELFELEKSTGQSPILLLDDVFSELDGRRRRALADTLKDYQTFITTTDADIVAKEFTQRLHTIAT